MVGERVKWARQRRAMTQRELAEAANVPVRTLRRVETEGTMPRSGALRKLAEALAVRVEWLTIGEEPMLHLWHMTLDAQHAAQTGPGTEGLPGYVIVEGGPWRQGDDGEWTAERPERGAR